MENSNKKFDSSKEEIKKELQDFKQDFKFTDLFKLNKLISPKVITLLYWFTIITWAGSSFFGIIRALAMIPKNFTIGITTLIGYIIGSIFLFIFIRMAFEFIVIKFNNHDNIKKIADKF